jgi:UDP-N-acetylmuramyl pentapeptide phosphotransferase/UDP-N-acetylglucosamine-1-phosphate transferase
MYLISTYLFSHSFFAIILSFVIGFIMMPFILKVAKAKGLVALPNGRTSHQGEIPNVGGLNIFSSWFITFMLLFIPSAKDQYLFAGIYVMMFVGLVDDILHISPKKKLLGEIVSGIFIIILGQVHFTHLHGFIGITIISEFISYPLSFFVFLLIVNSINLIDGVDGLASGLGMIASIFFGTYFYLVGQEELSVMAFSLLGSLLIFFFYNVYGGRKRKIFMGDCGALVLGYLFFFFTVRFCELNAHNQVPKPYHFLSAPVVAMCVLAIPLFDTLRVIITRIKKRGSPFHPDKNHIHHVMLKLGLKHRQIAMILMIVNSGFIALGVVGRNWPMILLAIVAFVLASGLTFFLWWLVNNRFKRLNDYFRYNLKLAVFSHKIDTLEHANDITNYSNQ